MTINNIKIVNDIESLKEHVAPLCVWLHPLAKPLNAFFEFDYQNRTIRVSVDNEVIFEDSSEDESIMQIPIECTVKGKVIASLLKSEELHLLAARVADAFAMMQENSGSAVDVELKEQKLWVAYDLMETLVSTVCDAWDNQALVQRMDEFLHVVHFHRDYMEHFKNDWIIMPTASEQQLQQLEKSILLAANQSNVYIHDDVLAGLTSLRDFLQNFHEGSVYFGLEL